MRALPLCAVVMLGLVAGGSASAQNPAANEIETLHTTTQLVVLDATVVDKQGHIVKTPLTRDDFEVQEDRKPQVIRYFESAAERDAEIGAGTPDAAPLLVAVLDELDFQYNHVESNADNIEQEAADDAHERGELVRYLETQPAQLNGPMEVLALTHHGYLIVAQPTHDRDQLIAKVKRRDPGLGSPFRDALEEGPDASISVLTLQAMWSLALRERGVPGRKIVLWLGYGGPSSALTPVFGGRPHRLSSGELYFREVTDLLVDARVTLDLFRPGVISGQPEESPTMGQPVSNDTPMSAGFNGYVQATGGVNDDGNNISGELSQTVNLSSVYYTISYAPQDHILDNQFRRIRVTVKGHPEWTVLTKWGYYALQYGGHENEQQQLQSDLSIATFEAMPFSAIGATLEQVARIQGTEEKGGFTARFVLDIDSDDLQWQTDPQTKRREANVAVSAAALTNVTTGNALASKAGEWKLTAKIADPKAPVRTTVALELHLPAKTKRVRFVVRDLANGRMGTTEVGMKAVQLAPETEENNQPLKGRPAGQ